MIEFLRGNLLSVRDEHVVVDVGGLGYGLDVPGSTRDRLPPVGEPVELHVSFLMREDAIRLFGFATSAEKSVFEILQNVPGVGPRIALDALSTIPIPDIVPALQTGNVALFTRIPGVGRKRAERLIVELRDRVKLFPTAADLAGPEGPGAGGPPSAPSLYDDAVAALVALGVKPAEAARSVSLALRSADEDHPTVEEVVRIALQVGR